MFLQMPFLFILYDVIKGLTNTIPAGQKFVSGTQQMIGTVCRPISPATVCAEPRYIPTTPRCSTTSWPVPGQCRRSGSTSP